MIKAQLTEFDFGPQHKEASMSFDKLKKQLDNNDAIFNDLEYFIHGSIGELKNQVMLRSEQLKVRIDEITQEKLADLDEYEKLCKDRCGDLNSKENFISLLNEFKEYNKDAKKMWEDGSRILNELKVDFVKWGEIKVKCDESLNNMSQKLKDFEKEVFRNELDTKKRQVEIFQKADIDSVLRKKVKLLRF